MRVLLVLRKSPEGSVAGNALKYGTGVLNIDGCRLACGEEHFVQGAITRRSRVSGDTREGDAAGSYRVGAAFYANNHPAGRWPANLALEHLPECKNTAGGWKCGIRCPVRALGDVSRFFKQVGGLQEPGSE